MLLHSGLGWGFIMEVHMIRGHFYFLKQQYFVDFPDPNLMANKEQIGDELQFQNTTFAIQ